MDDAQTIKIMTMGQVNPIYEYTTMWLHSDTVEKILERKPNGN